MIKIKILLFFFLIFPFQVKALDFTEISFQVPQKKHLAPELSLPLLGSHSKNIKNFLLGKWTILHFWEINCLPCQKEMPLLQKFAQNHQNPQLQILTISPDKEKRLVKYLKKKKIPFPVFMDRKGKALDLYEIIGFPTTYIINPQGYLVAKKMGEIDWTDPKIISFFQILSLN